LQAAISSPLLEEASIEGAKGILLNITGDSSLTLHEVNEAATAIHQVADKDAHIIFGAVIDESMGDQIKITVIATGFKEKILAAPKKVEFSRAKAEASVESSERLSEINVRGGRRFPIREHFSTEYKERFNAQNLDQPYLRKSEEG
jgi:cell division GTPase FtsZ